MCKIEELRVGQYVRIKSTGEIGDILDTDIEEDEVYVSMLTDNDVRFLKFDEIESV